MSAPTVRECYRRLNLPPGAPWPEVRAAFRRTARETHPDVKRNGRSRDFERASEAYMTLRDMFRSGEIPKDRPPEDTKPSFDLSRIWSSFAKASSWVSRTFEDAAGKRKKKRDEKARTRMEEENRRFRLVEDAIAEAENSLDAILERGGKTGGISERHRLLRRLTSSLPEIRSMAIAGLIPSVGSTEVSLALERCISRYGLDEDGMDALFSVRDPMTGLKFALAAASHFEFMTASTARKYLRWLKSVPGGHSVYSGLPCPASSQVAGILMSQWPVDLPLPSESRILAFLNGQDEVLVPTLRQLYRRGCPPSILGRVKIIHDNSHDPAVKAWSRAIVCKSSVV